MRLGLLCSGNLGLNVLQFIATQHNLIFVATDSQSHDIISYCQEKQIHYFLGNPRNGKLANFLSSLEYDILISANYLFIIEMDVIQTPTCFAFNIHGSLLPKYRGRTPHVWAIINGEKNCGITAHLIDDGCDTGNILHQIEIPILQNDTGATILEKYKENYIPIINKVLDQSKKGILQTIPQNNANATFFGKRTPEDGLINWNWQSDRIYNWVRAQSYPYPGAFTFLNDKRLIIDWVQPTDLGFDYLEENGKIIKIDDNSLYVKCPNKVLKIEKFRNLHQIEFKKNMILQ